MVAILRSIFPVVAHRDLSRDHVANSEAASSQIMAGKMGYADRQVVFGEIRTAASGDICGDSGRLPTHALPSFIRGYERFDAVSRFMRRQLRRDRRREYAEAAPGGNLRQCRVMFEAIFLPVHTQVLSG